MQSWVPTLKRILLFSSNINKSALYNVQYLHSSKNNLTNSDVLDDFATQLLKEKSEKWKQTAIMKKSKLQQKDDFSSNSLWSFNLKSRLLSVLNLSKTLDINIVNLSSDQINSLFNGALDSKDYNNIEFLSQQCLTHQQCPSSEILNTILHIYSSDGNIETVESLIELCRNKQFDFYSENHELKHFVAKCIWIKGDVGKAIDLFQKLYVKCQDRYVLRRMMKSLINDTVFNKSEASTVVLTKKIKTFCDDCQDWYVMTYLWENCWLSEWYGDQQLSESLFNECAPLRLILSDKIPALCSVVLKNHQEDAIIRLLQTLLANDMKFLYVKVLENLFIYRYKREDLYGCHQIVRNCIPLNIKLKSDIQTKYLTLLISNGYIVKPTKPPVKTSVTESMKFKF